MHSRVRILNIATYHPEKIVTNEPYIEHFKKRGKDISHLLIDVVGRNKRYLIDNTGKKDEDRENSLTMQVEVAKRVLEKCNLKGSDLDGIILASQVPEYLVPPSSVLIHNAIDAKMDSFCYDLNANCITMVMALDQAYRYFELNSRIEKILIVGGDWQSIAIQDNAETMYGCFGDAACAIILERTDLDSGYVDSDYFTDHDYTYCARFPGDGLTKIMDGGSFQGMDGPVDCDIPIVIEKIKEILQRNSLSINDISGFCFSQFVRQNIYTIQEALDIPTSICPYVGDVYGYTGISSPFLALNDLVQKGKVRQGDYVFFWTLGTGMQHIFELIKY